MRSELGGAPGGAAAMIVALLSFLVASGVARARELQIQELDARITVDPAGWIEVTEAIQVHFVGPWQGLYRSIPLEYQRDDGRRFVLSLQVRDVRDGQGTPLQYHADRDDGRQKMRIVVPGAVDATRTVVITYRCSNALHFLNDHDELYWNVTGNDWDAPIQLAAAQVTLPAGVTGARARVFTGPLGSRDQDADIQLSSSTVTLRTRHPLPLHTGLTVVVDWDKGFVKESRWLFSVGGLMAVGFPGGALLLLFALWLARNRARSAPAVGVRYHPPYEMTPVEVGALADNRVDARDVTATLVDLAVRGYLAIEQPPPPPHRGAFAFRRRSAPPQWASLAHYEQTLLGAIFSGQAGQETIVTSADLPSAFFNCLPLFKTQVFDALIARGFYRSSPERTRRHYRLAGLVIAALMTAAGAAANLLLLELPLWPFMVGGLITWAVVALFGGIMATPTERGASALQEIRGFKRFLAQIGEGGEWSQKVVRTPEMFDAFLAYAMALKVEKVWVRAFQGLYTDPGDWYRSADEQTYKLQNPPDNLDDLNCTIAVHISSSQGSGDSSSSGSDGGSSGGGMGGGGGGGF